MLGVADDIAKEYLNRVRVKDRYISAACPFHKDGQERHPSFWIDRETGAWRGDGLGPVDIDPCLPAAAFGLRGFECLDARQRDTESAVQRFSAIGRCELTHLHAVDHGVQASVRVRQDTQERGAESQGHPLCEPAAPEPHHFDGMSWASLRRGALA